MQEVEGPREFPEGDFREQSREAVSCPCGGQGSSADDEAVSCAGAGSCASEPVSCRGRRAEAVDGGIAAHGECQPEDRDEGSEGSGRRTTSFVRTGRTGARARRGSGRRRSAASSATHGRTPQPALEEVEERLEVAEDACSCCVANGSYQDHRDQKRRIVRRGCDCPGSPVAAVSRHRIRVWTHELHERVHARRVARPRAFVGNAGQRAGCCPCSSRFGTRSSRTGVCAMPMHPGPEGGPEVAPGSGHRSAVTRSSPSRSAEVTAKLFADAPMSATATAPARSWRACGPSSSCAVAGRIVGATFRTAPAAAGGVGGRTGRSRRSAA